MPLDEIGISTGTDKSSKIHDYLGVYEQQLRHLRDEKFQLVEIGVHKGASTRMWAEYFWRAQVIGVDIDPACKSSETDRIKIIIGNQGQAGFLAKMAKQLRPLILIDDGSHRWAHQINTFRALFPIVREGGYFIVEDIHTSFGDDYAATYGEEGAQTAYEYMSELALGIVAGSRADKPKDDFEAYCRSTIESIVFLKHSLVVKKRDFPQRVLHTKSVADVVKTASNIDVGAEYPRIPAEVVNASQYVTNTFRKLVDGGPVTFAPARSADVADVTVIAQGLATHGDKTIFAETLNAAQNLRRVHPVYRPGDSTIWVTQERTPNAVFVPAVPGKHHVLLKQTWDANYGHWLIDALPKLSLLPELHDLADCLFVLNPQRVDAMRSVVLDSLALAGIREDQALFLDDAPRRFERLTVLGTIGRHPVAKAPRAISYLEQLAEGVEPFADERIYVSRNLSSRRRLVNEDAVVDVLKQHGYVVVHPETLTFREQVATFRAARHVVGNMGAALANLAFSPQDVTVLALATERMNHDYFYDIVCHKTHGRYQGLQGKAVVDSPDIGSDFTIDLELLEQSLSWAHEG